VSGIKRQRIKFESFLKVKGKIYQINLLKIKFIKNKKLEIKIQLSLKHSIWKKKHSSNSRNINWGKD